MIDEWVIEQAKSAVVDDGLAAIAARAEGRDHEADALEARVDRFKAWVVLLESNDELRPDDEVPELELVGRSVSGSGVYAAPAWFTPDNDPHRLLVEGLEPKDRRARSAWHADRIETELTTLRRVLGETAFAGVPPTDEVREGLASAARRRVSHHLSVIRTLETRRVAWSERTIDWRSASARSATGWMVVDEPPCHEATDPTSAGRSAAAVGRPSRQARPYGRAPSAAARIPRLPSSHERRRPRVERRTYPAGSRGRGRCDADVHRSGSRSP